MNAPEISVLMLRGVVAGVVGTGGMTGILALIDRQGLANTRMEVAIGSIVTKSRTNATGVGLAIHFAAGICFAMLYTALFVVTGIHGIVNTTGIGLIAGFVHGFAMSFILVVLVAEHHPLPEFREAGFAVAVVHVVGHVIYGALVGLVFALTGIPFHAAIS
jgi:hypothetical protein